MAFQSLRWQHLSSFRRVAASAWGQHGTEANLVVGLADVSNSQTADLRKVFATFPAHSPGFHSKLSRKQKIPGEQQFCGGKCHADVKKVRTDRLVGDHKPNRPLQQRVSGVLPSLWCTMRHLIGHFIWQTVCLIKWPVRIFFDLAEKCAAAVKQLLSSLLLQPLGCTIAVNKSSSPRHCSLSTSHNKSLL